MWPYDDVEVSKEPNSKGSRRRPRIINLSLELGTTSDLQSEVHGETEKVLVTSLSLPRRSLFQCI